MSSATKRGNGGNNRISGRRSIHNNNCINCPFWKSETMGRYGLKQSEHGTCSTSQSGTDEVDNVMSKLARASSPVAARKTYRRNSLNSSDKCENNTTEDSDEDSEEEEGASRRNYSNISRTSSSSQCRLNSSGSRSSNSTPSQYTQHIRSRETRNEQEIKMRDCTSFLITSFIVTVCVGVVAYYYVRKIPDAKDIYDKYKFYQDIKLIGKKYSVNENSLLQVRAGISTVFERQDTGSFIFTYNSGRRDFNLENFNYFMNELALYAAKYLRNHTSNNGHVIIDTSNLHSKSVHEIIKGYVEDVNKTGVLLVIDLDRVPTSMASAFHYICDEFNPLVKKSVVFFTLNMARCPSMTNEKYTHKNIEKCLAEKWANMPQDTIVPLLNRIVNVVVDVASDF